MDQRLDTKKSSIPTKLMFGFLCFLGFGTLLLGIIKVDQTLNIVGNNSLSVNEGANDAYASLMEVDEQNTDNLQITDKDGDGLTDYEEIYIYSTSPYLVDSDSDGYSDKEEIDGGFDPNCPKGQDCRGAETGNQTVPVPEANTTPDGEITPGSETLPTKTTDLLKNLTPEEVRQLLLENENLTDEEKQQIGQIDDETLMQIFQEVLNN